MAVLIKLSATLREHVKGYDPLKGMLVEAREGEDVSGLAARIGIPLDEVKIIMINGVAGQKDHPVADGDRIGLFPPVGGG